MRTQYVTMKSQIFSLLFIALGCLLLLSPLLQHESIAAEQNPKQNPIELLYEVENYRQLLAELEATSGPYSADLFEPLATLARALVTAEIYSEAEEVIGRGMQVSRINEGLYSLQQLPLLLLGIEMNVKLRDFAAANDRSDYLVELYTNGFSNEPLDLLQSLETVSDWHLSVLSRDEELNRALHLLKSHDINLRMTQMALQQQPLDLARQNYYLYRQALSTYYFTSAMAVGGITGARILTETGTLGLIRQTENTARKFPRDFEDKLDQSLALLKRVMESYGDSTEPLSEARVMASIYYADWRILYRDGKRVIGESSPLNTPRRLYRQAREDLITLGYEAEAVEGYFSTPALLPVTEFTESFEQALELAQGVRTSPLEITNPDVDEENTELARLPDFIAWSESLFGVTMPTTNESNLADELADLYGDVRFRVDTSGKASRLRVLQHHPANKSQRAELLREVQSLVFRPGLIDGRFRNSEMMTMRYYYPLDARYRDSLGQDNE